MKRLVAMAIVIAVLSGCVTTGWSPRRDYLFDQEPTKTTIGTVDTTKLYWHPLFIGKSSVKKRQELEDVLLQLAKDEFGPTAGLTNIRFESAWHAASLLFYLSMLGFVGKEKREKRP